MLFPLHLRSYRCLLSLCSIFSCQKHSAQRNAQSHKVIGSRSALNRRMHLLISSGPSSFQSTFVIRNVICPEYFGCRHCQTATSRQKATMSPLLCLNSTTLFLVCAPPDTWCSLKPPAISDQAPRYVRQAISVCKCLSRQVACLLTWMATTSGWRSYHSIISYVSDICKSAARILSVIDNELPRYLETCRTPISLSALYMEYEFPLAQIIR